MTRTNTPLTLLILVWFVMMASACATKSSQKTYFYVINPVETDASLIANNSEKHLALEITSLSVPQYLERPQIVTRSGTNQLEINEYHRWGGNLRKNISRVIAKNLSLYLNTPDIFIVPHVSHTKLTHRVMIEIISFERYPDNRVKLSSLWTLTDPTSGKTITKSSDYEISLSKTKGGIEESVNAMGQALAMLSREIADATRFFSD